jgi:hypothetical protein
VLSLLKRCPVVAATSALVLPEGIVFLWSSFPVVLVNRNPRLWRIVVSGVCQQTLPEQILAADALTVVIAKRPAPIALTSGCADMNG